jgi:ubiquinone/menaquinone biosynthesis C-methylase UbiE
VRYDRLAPDYDRRWRRYIEATVRETLARVDLAGAPRVLDVGCGTGAVAAAARARFPTARVVGVDLSPRMLELARRKLGAGAWLVVGEAERLPFRSGAFDAAVSASALHYWKKPLAALAEIRRVLRAGGTVAITDWSADRWIERLRDLVRRRLEPAHQRVHRAADLAGMLETVGLHGVRVERWGIGRGWRLMTGLGIREGAE